MHFSGLLLALPLALNGAFASPLENAVDKRHAPSCGVVGYDSGKFVVNKRQCSLSECQGSCQKSSKCQSYGYGQKTCRLYIVSVAKNVHRKAGSPYKFYDKACKSPQKSSTTKARSTTTTTTRNVATSSTTSSRLTTSSSTTARPASTTTASSTISSTTTAVAQPTTCSAAESEFCFSTTSTTTTTTTTTPAVACASGMPFTLRGLINNQNPGVDPQGYIPQELISGGPRTDPAYLIFSQGITAAVFALDTSCRLISQRSGNSATVIDDDVTTINFDVNTGATEGVCDVIDVNIGTSELRCTFGSRTSAGNRFGIDGSGRTYVGVDDNRGITQSVLLAQFQ